MSGSRGSRARGSRRGDGFHGLPPRRRCGLPLRVLGFAVAAGLMATRLQDLVDSRVNPYRTPAVFFP